MAIDWIEFEIQTQTPTNFMEICRATGLPYVEAQGAGRDRAASIFRFKVQDPKNHQTIKALMTQLDEKFPLQRPPVITGIEVAFDTSCPGASARQLAEVVADRHRWTTHKPDHDWHLYRKKGQGRIYLNAIDRLEFIQRLVDGWQLTDTATKKAPARIHAYVKTSNAGLGLEPHQWRARFEVTLTGHALPCTTLDQLERFDFTSLSAYFKFRQYADNNPHKAIAHARRWMGITQPGRRGTYQRRTATSRVGGTREFKSWTSPDSQLNDEIYSQLRKLTRSWRGKLK